jgi:hypothetical protein
LAGLIEELYHKLRPCPPEQPDLEKFLKRARKRKRPSLEVRFDLPELYGAEPDGTPTQLRLSVNRGVALDDRELVRRDIGSAAKRLFSCP